LVAPDLTGRAGRAPGRPDCQQIGDWRGGEGIHRVVRHIHRKLMARPHPRRRALPGNVLQRLVRRDPDDGEHRQTPDRNRDDLLKSALTGAAGDHQLG